MKFDKHRYWKHENCTDAFFRVDSVEHDSGEDRSSVLYGHWMIQGLFNHWYASDFHKISINSKNYDKWKPYDLLTMEKV